MSGSRLLYRLAPLAVAVTVALGIAALLTRSTLWQRADVDSGVVLEPSYLSLDDVGQGESIVRILTLRNDLQEDVRIVGVKSSCNCMTLSTELVGKVLPPRGETVVPVEFRTGTSDGPISGTVTVYYLPRGVGLISRCGAIIAATVSPDYRLHPPSVDFGTVTGPTDPARTIRLHPMRDPDVQIVDVQCSHREFVIERNPATGDPRAISVRFVPRGDTTTRAYTGFIAVKTTSTRAPIAHIPVQGYYAPLVQASPPALVFSPDITSELRLPVRIQSASASKLLQVECEPPGVFAVSCKLGANGKEHLLEVRTLDTIGATDVHGRLCVRLELAGAQCEHTPVELALPIHVLRGREE